MTSPSTSNRARTYGRFGNGPTGGTSSQFAHHSGICRDIYHRCTKPSSQVGTGLGEGRTRRMIKTMVTINIPTALRPYSQGREHVQVDGDATLRAVFERLEKEAP